MSESRKSATLWQQVALAVLVALIAGGTAPWWWNEFFASDRSHLGGSGGDVHNTYAGASYEVKCHDAEYGNIFVALIQFPSATSARWRYKDSTSWEQTLSVEPLSPQRLLLTAGDNDSEQRTWNLTFLGDFRAVEGSYKFLQTDPARWRNYKVNGSRIE